MIAIKEQMIQPPPLHSKGPPPLLLRPVLSAPAHAARLPGSGDHHHSTGRSSRAQLTRNDCCLLHDSSKNLLFFFLFFRNIPIKLGSSWR